MSAYKTAPGEARTIGPYDNHMHRQYPGDPKPLDVLAAALKPLVEQSATWPDFVDGYPVVLTNKGIEYSLTTLGTLRAIVAAAPKDE